MRSKEIDIVGRGQTGTMFYETLRRVPGLILIGSDRVSLPEDLLSRGPAFIILATRNPIDEAIETIKNNAIDGSTVLLTQNGVDGPEVARTGLHDRNINLLSGALVTNVSRTGHGEILYNPEKLRIGLAPVQGPNVETAVHDAKELFKLAGYETKVYHDYVQMVWTKLFANMINFSAIEHGLPPGEAFRDQKIFNQEINAMVDRLKILHAAGIHLINLPGIPGRLIDAGLSFPLTPKLLNYLKSQLADWLSRERNGSLPAAARDMAAGKPTEARYYLEPWIDLGSKVGIRNPLDEHLLKVVNLYEAPAFNLPG